MSGRIQIYWEFELLELRKKIYNARQGVSHTVLFKFVDISTLSSTLSLNRSPPSRRPSSIRYMSFSLPTTFRFLLRVGERSWSIVTFVTFSILRGQWGRVGSFAKAQATNGCRDVILGYGGPLLIPRCRRSRFDDGSWLSKLLSEGRTWTRTRIRIEVQSWGR